jgi:alkanesulfonate monooxygenase SsuD/methylene tetrahydromethanopterin reductase-like flavin-dependent oxidoreductase (luciferase family)
VTFLGLRFDLRNPAFAGTTMTERYAAAIEMSEWAERVGMFFVVLCEHHGSDDGYLPSPLILASAIAARTTTLSIQVAAIVAPFHDPLRLAEDAAVADLIAGGRLDLVVTGGYVPDEFAMFGVPLRERPARTAEAIRTMQAAWSGEPFAFRDRTVRVTPAPERPAGGGPGITMGGSSDGAARRAARLGVGYSPSSGDSWEAFRSECLALGRDDPGPHHGKDSTATIVAADVEEGWAAIGPYAMHEANAYGAWAAASGVATGYRQVGSIDELRESGQYRVVTPATFVEEMTAEGPFGFAILHPMLGGIPPALAWEQLHLIEHEVLPHLPS